MVHEVEMVDSVDELSRERERQSVFFTIVNPMED